jgi:hypothetical protein
LHGTAAKVSYVAALVSAYDRLAHETGYLPLEMKMSDPIDELEQDANAAFNGAISAWFNTLSYVRAHAVVAKEVAAAVCLVMLAILLWRAL